MSKKSKEKIHFHFMVPRFHFPKRTELKKFIADKLKKSGKRIDTINIIFCDDECLGEINKNFLNHTTLTDIITFDFSEGEQPLLSDIYISVPRIHENSQIFKTSFRNELHRVIFHGFLHLLGFGDKTEFEKAKMRTAENAWLLQYFVPRETKPAKH